MLSLYEKTVTHWVFEWEVTEEPANKKAKTSKVLAVYPEPGSNVGRMAVVTDRSPLSSAGRFGVSRGR